MSMHDYLFIGISLLTGIMIGIQIEHLLLLLHEQNYRTNVLKDAEATFKAHCHRRKNEMDEITIAKAQARIEKRKIAVNK